MFHTPGAQPSLSQSPAHSRAFTNCLIFSYLLFTFKVVVGYLARIKSHVSNKMCCGLFVLLIVYLFIAILGFELKALYLLSRYSITWARSPALLALVIFPADSHTFSWAGLDLNLPVCASCIVGVIGMNHHTRVIGWDGFPLTFCLGWPWTTILLISASWVDRFKDVSHHIWQAELPEA
jgi:hypothetical protein